MVMSQDALQDNFQLPLLEQAFGQFCELELFMQALLLNDNGDQWKYICQINIHQVKLINISLVHNQFTLLAYVFVHHLVNKSIVFYWLLMKNRLNTKRLAQEEEHAPRVL
jgi:hypothetical protein